MKFIFIAILFFSTIVSGQSSTPFVLGVTDELQSKVLQEKRLLNIYLPEGYQSTDSIKYPVIYLLDGSADEDFIHIAGLVQFCSFEWVHLIPRCIVVGIATVDRRRDFTFPTTIEADKIRFPSSGHSDQFIRFIEEELQPYIQQHYAANSSSTIIGQSLGGLLVTEILFKKPTLFRQYLIISPSLWWDNGSILQTTVPDTKNIQIYIAVGKEGLAPGKVPRVMEVDANVLADQLKGKATVYFDYLPDENHATILHQAVLNAFKKISL